MTSHTNKLLINVRRINFDPVPGLDQYASLSGIFSTGLILDIKKLSQVDLFPKYLKKGF